MQSLLDAWADPHARHAILVHWPIVLTPVAAALLLWFVLSRVKNKGAAVSAVCVLLGATIGAGLAAGAGEAAAERVEASVPPLTILEDAALERHEALGEGAWIWPGACALLAAGAMLPTPKRLGPALAVMALLATLGVSARFAWTAHTGGALVYTHGLGVPKRVDPQLMDGGVAPGPSEQVRGEPERGEHDDEPR